MNENKGFTLLELLVALAIIGALAAVSVPGYLAWYNNARFMDAAQLASSSMRTAKGKAIHANQKIRVVFTLDSSVANSSNRVRIETVPPAPVVVISSAAFAPGIKVRGGTDCDSTSEVLITFNPNGSSRTGYICILDDETKKYKIGIGNANTSRIVTTKF